MDDMATRIDAVCWEDTPLGPRSAWSVSLRTAVDIVLSTRYPMLLSWGEDLVMLYNDAFVPTLGTKHPEALGSPLRDTFAEIWDSVGPLQRGVLGGGGSVWFEDLPFSIERGAGPEETFFTFSYSHVRDDAGGPGGVLAVLSVTTGAVVGARRLATLNRIAALAADQDDPGKALASVMGVLGDAGADLAQGLLIVRDEHGTAVGHEHRFGDAVVTEAALRDACRTAAGTSGLTLLDADGTRVVAAPVRGDGAEPIATLALVPHPHRPWDDEHERFLNTVVDQVGLVAASAAARAREQARIAALAALDTAKTAFLSQVSHEFRTPLTLVLGPLEDVLEGTTDALRLEQVGPMHDAAVRLLRLVNGLLDASRIETHASVASLEPVEVGTMTEDLVSLFTDAAARAGLEVRSQIDPGLGVVSLDPVLWDRVVVNLLGNAMKYTLDGHVVVSLHHRDDLLILTVTDTGIGIPAADLPRVFERFHRAGGDGGRTIEGSGLGLSLVADAVQALGGTVSVDSTEGVGSVFRVVVPWRPETLDQMDVSGSAPVRDRDRRLTLRLASVARDVLGDTGAQAPHTGDEVPASPQGRTVLVVDDHAGVRRRVAHLLGELGTVLEARDGLDALETLRSTPVDLVVTDAMMPRLDGVGLIREIREDPTLRTLPVLMLSARAGADAAADAVGAGADDYVVKPFTPQELLARCRTTLELADLRRDAVAAQLRQTLLAGISHDMQTPVSVISTALELLASPTLPEGRREEITQRAAARARYLRRLVTRFLDWSRLSLGEPLPVSLHRIAVIPLVTRVCADYPTVELELEACPPQLQVRCDPLRTEQILHNLIVNALRYARARVEVSVTPGEDGAVVVRVRDDGPGVPEAFRTRLFTPFGSTAGADGSGLGLYVSRHSALAMSATLDLEETGPFGTTLALVLPRGEG